jgi:hypothetical protein
MRQFAAAVSSWAVPITGGALPSVLKQSTPLASPPKPRTPVWPEVTGLATYTYEDTLLVPATAVLSGLGWAPAV